jgi:hypothetical protein
MNDIPNPSGHAPDEKPKLSESTPDEQPLPVIPQQSSRNTSTILIIGLGLLVFCVCILPVLVIIVLALLGPAIGNVFSEIVDELQMTPTPGFILFLGFSPAAFIGLMRSKG